MVTPNYTRIRTQVRIIQIGSDLDDSTTVTGAPILWSIGI